MLSTIPLPRGTFLSNGVLVIAWRLLSCSIVTKYCDLKPGSLKHGKAVRAKL